MTTTINASTSSGLVNTADTSGIIKLQSNGVTTNALAWVNFNGGNGNTAGAIVASYNVSSITVNGTGDYTVNYTTAMSNASYTVFGGCLESTSNGALATNRVVAPTRTAPLVGSVRVGCVYFDASFQNPTSVFVSIFGN